MKKSHLKIFLFTFLMTFIMATLQYLGVRLPNIISPLAHKDDIFETIIRPKIEYKQNSYRLVKPQEIIQKAHAGEAIDQASAYVVVDLDTGKVIAEKNAERPLPMASLTKIMTVIVALDLADPSESFTVTKKAAGQIPTKIGVVPSEKLTLSELIQAAMLTSANDAVEVIRDGIDAKYKKDIFIRAMNEKAAYLGLSHTHFTNPQGFDNPSHYSSVEDLVVLTHYAFNNYPLFAEVVRKDYAFLPENNDHGQFDLYNWNGLVGVYPGTFGVKIGNTGNAGKTTIVAAEREGKKMIAAILGAPDIEKRDLWAADLLNFGFEEEYNMEPIEITKKQLHEKYSTWRY